MKEHQKCGGKCGLHGWCGGCECRTGQWMYECSGGVRDVSAIMVCGVHVHPAGCSRPDASAVHRIPRETTIVAPGADPSSLLPLPPSIHTAGCPRSDASAVHRIPAGGRTRRSADGGPDPSGQIQQGGSQPVARQRAGAGVQGAAGWHDGGCV